MSFQTTLATLLLHNLPMAHYFYVLKKKKNQFFGKTSLFTINPRCRGNSVFLFKLCSIFIPLFAYILLPFPFCSVLISEWIKIKLNSLEKKGEKRYLCVFSAVFKTLSALIKILYNYALQNIIFAVKTRMFLDMSPLCKIFSHVDK